MGRRARDELRRDEELGEQAAAGRSAATGRRAATGRAVREGRTGERAEPLVAQAHGVVEAWRFAWADRAGRGSASRLAASAASPPLRRWARGLERERSRRHVAAASLRRRCTSALEPTLATSRSVVRAPLGRCLGAASSPGRVVSWRRLVSGPRRQLARPRRRAASSARAAQRQGELVGAGYLPNVARSSFR